VRVCVCVHTMNEMMNESMHACVWLLACMQYVICVCVPTCMHVTGGEHVVRDVYDRARVCGVQQRKQ